MNKVSTLSKVHTHEQQLLSWSESRRMTCPPACPHAPQHFCCELLAETLAQAGVKIQSGGQGTVVAVEDPHTRQMVAVKYISADEKRAKQSETAAVSSPTPPALPRRES